MTFMDENCSCLGGLKTFREEGHTGMKTAWITTQIPCSMSGYWVRLCWFLAVIVNFLLVFWFMDSLKDKKYSLPLFSFLQYCWNVDTNDYYSSNREDISLMKNDFTLNSLLKENMQVDQCYSRDTRITSLYKWHRKSN
jgi:hypothetical protein